MNLQRPLIALAALNLLLLAYIAVQPPAGATQNAPAILRGSGLEIVDGRGQVRASISVLPGDPSFRMPDGTIGYPEMVLLRLISPEGKPNVKIDASELGAGLGLGGETDPTYIRLQAEGAGASLELIDKDGRKRSVKP
jgi:hypothetical protein